MVDRKDPLPQSDGPSVYLAPWEKAFDRILTPFEEFIQRQTTTGLLLMSTAIIALLIANSPLFGPYQHLVHLPIGITIGDWVLEQSLHHWINDGLMTLFFFVVGLELKREMLVGELARPRQAALPIIAAIGGMLIPALISAQVSKLMARFDASHHNDRDILTNQQLHSIVQSLEQGAQLVATPLQRLEHAWHLPVSFLVIPVFALFNAGIPLDFQAMGDTLTHPVTLGVMLGLVFGQFIGITLACWLALKCGIGQLPAQTRFSQIAGVALLAGIGFTMAIFIAELGYADQPELLLMAKTGILAASLLAGVTSFIWLWWVARKPRA
jgi:Na+/H+ antiporter NhaA